MPDSVLHSRLTVLMFTDLVESAALTRQLGDADYVQFVLEPHNAIFRDLIAEWPQARVVKQTGDGFLATFASTSDAVNCALRFHQALRNAAWVRITPETRIGIHLGEMVELTAFSEKADIAGDAANMAARVMNLAIGRQTLMTQPAFDSARQSGRVKSIDDSDTENAASIPIPSLQWLAHGRYWFKGAETPMEVFEVGIVGIAPLVAPADSDKARRAVAEEEAVLLGWRPSPGSPVLNRPGWELVEELGKGGFGEVWLARQRQTKNERVFKFCFDAERLQSLKREVMFFRLIRDHLGDRDDIARLVDVHVEAPPFFLESEHVRGGNMKEWAKRHGRLEAIPLSVRLTLLSGVSRAVAAAHSLGIIHKDLKPSNILIVEDADGTPRPRLCDFGIGVLIDRRFLDQSQITTTGLTAALTPAEESYRTGTRMYAPPESLLDKPASTAGDIYALGVMLFQLAAGDLDRPLAIGWQEEVHDELLREDITSCTHGDPTRRLVSASELADRLDRLDLRRTEREAQRCAKEQLQRMRRMRFLAITAVCATILASALTVFVKSRADRLQVALARNHFEYGNAAYRAKRPEEGVKELLQAIATLPSGDPVAPAYRRVLRDRVTQGARLVGVPIRHDSPIASLAFSPDSREVLTGTTSGTTHLCSLDTGEPLRGPLRQRGSVKAVGFDQTGRFVITATPKSVCSWSRAAFEKVDTLRLQEDDVITAGAVSPDRKWLVLGTSSGKSLIVMINDRGELQYGVKPISGFSNQILTITISPDSQFAAIVGEGGLRVQVIKISDGTIVASLAPKTPQFKACFNPDGDSLSTSAAGAVLWNWKSESTLQSTNLDDSYVTAMDFSPDGNILALGTAQALLRLWDTRTRSLIKEVSHQSAITVIAFSKWSDCMVTADRDGVVKFWGSRGFDEFAPDIPHSEAVEYAQFVSDGLHVLVVGTHGTVYIWKIHHPTPLGKPVPHDALVNRLRFTDESHVEVGTGNHRRVWRWEDQTKVEGTALGPDGLQCNESQDGTVAIMVQGDYGDAMTVQKESRSGRWGAVGYYGGRIELSDHSTGAQHIMYHGDSGVVPNRSVFSLTFSPDETTLLSTSADHTARLWDVRTGAQLGPSFPHSCSVTSGAFHGAGDRIVTGTANGRVQVWDAGAARMDGYLDSADDFVAWIELATGMEYAGNSAWSAVTIEDWSSKWQRLQDKIAK